MKSTTSIVYNVSRSSISSSIFEKTDKLICSLYSIPISISDLSFLILYTLDPKKNIFVSLISIYLDTISIISIVFLVSNVL